MLWLALSEATSGAGAGVLSVLGTVAQILAAVAALFTAWVAWVGVSTWWKQIHGQNTYELATDLKAACGRVRDEIEQLRKPQLPPEEVKYLDIPTRIDQPVEWVETAYEERMDAVENERSKLRRLIVRAGAVWEEEEDELENEFRRLTAAVRLLDTERRRHISFLQSDLGLGDEQWERTRRELWGRSDSIVERQLWENGDEDWVGTRIDDSLNVIEGVADSKIRDIRPTDSFPWPWS